MPNVSSSNAGEVLRGLVGEIVAKKDVACVDLEVAPDWFHDGQNELWAADFDVILALWGTQAGKTVAGPHWCLREAARTGPGEGAVVGPNYSLLFKKVVPEFRKVWAEYGQYIGSPIPRFVVHEVGMVKLFGLRQDRLMRWPDRDPDSLIVHFGYAENSDSLESMTLNWVWSDEAGQGAYKVTSYEALERRLLIRRGRHLLTTTPYVFGWLKENLHDAWLDGSAPHVGVLNIPSIANPTMSLERVQRAKDAMPAWRFQMMYEGKFTRPAGAIYDCFARETHCVKRRLIPRHWSRYQGIDFGGTNTASTWGAEDPATGIIYLYRTYHDGNKAVSEHAEEWRALEEKFFEQTTGVFGYIPELKDQTVYGGAPSEDFWRTEFSESGYPISRPPFKDVEPGIARVYALMKLGRLKVFDDLTFLIKEIETYSRKVTDSGEPLAEIEDKAKFHRADSLRALSFGVQIDTDWVMPAIVNKAKKQNPEFSPKDDEDEEDEPRFTVTSLSKIIQQPRRTTNARRH